MVGELQLAGLSSLAQYARPDPRNDAVVFTLGYDERQGASVVRAYFTCEVSSPAGSLVAEASWKSGRVTCMLPLGEAEAVPEEFRFTLKLHSGFEQLHFQVHSSSSFEIPHSNHGSLDSLLAPSPVHNVSELASELQKEELIHEQLRQATRD